jgi:hypothetical protein
MSINTIVSIAGALGLTFAVQLRAQENPKRPITVTGCLQRAHAQPGRPAANVVGTTGSDQFVLTKIEVAKRQAARSTGQEDTTSASATSEADDRWFVVTGGADLQANVDRRVEIIGTVDTTGSVLGTSASVSDGPSREIHATALKVVTASCDR